MKIPNRTGTWFELRAARDDILKYQMSEPRRYRAHYLCEWRPDHRTIALHDLLNGYYNDTKDCSNTVAMVQWAKFKQRCAEQGYTQCEINQAKRAGNK